MSDAANHSTRRSYRSELRDRRAAETRAQILDAGATLFVRAGYAGTTMRAVAAQAGTSERTVYLHFATKAHLLSEAIRAAVRAGDEHTAMLDQEGWQRLIAGTSADEAVAELARLTTELWGRTARLIQVAESAALSDPVLAAFRDRGRQATAEDITAVVAGLVRGGVVDGAASRRVADALYALLGSSELYLRLVEQRDGTPASYEAMLRSMIKAVLAGG